MYTATGTKAIDKDQFITEFTPLVKRIAYHMMTRLPASVQVDDLIQAGMMGLLDAINRYEGSYGRQFESYAAQRIRGSILDELREADWLPRSIRTVSYTHLDVYKRQPLLEVTNESKALYCIHIQRSDAPG